LFDCRFFVFINKKKRVSPYYIFFLEVYQNKPFLILRSLGVACWLWLVVLKQNRKPTLPTFTFLVVSAAQNMAAPPDC
jgi:hypothetical protein